MAVPTTLAEVWFPPHERTQATAVSALGSQSGTVLLSIIVPIVCPDDATTTSADAVRQQWRYADHAVWRLDDRGVSGRVDVLVWVDESAYVFVCVLMRESARAPSARA